MTNLHVAVYDNLETARDVVDELIDEGYSSDDISLVVRDRDGQYAELAGREVTGMDEDEDVDAAEGAGFGALVGGLTGVLAALSPLLIPGIGPIVAAGPIAAALAGGTVGAVTGAATGGVIAALVDLGVSEENAHAYAEAVRRGGVLVAVDSTKYDEEETDDILRDYNPIDITRSATTWRESGWKRFDPEAEPYDDEEEPDFYYYD